LSSWAVLSSFREFYHIPGCGPKAPQNPGRLE
jgi:hypothetical protein